MARVAWKSAPPPRSAPPLLKNNKLKGNRPRAAPRAWHARAYAAAASPDAVTTVARPWSGGDLRTGPTALRFTWTFSQKAPAWTLNSVTTTWSGLTRTLVFAGTTCSKRMDSWKR